MTSRNLTPLLPLADAATRDLERSISDTAHVLFFGAIGWPWLLRSLSGGSRAQKAALIERLGLAPDALPYLGSWKADTGLLTLLADHVEARRPETVVEFGMGASSLVIGRALQLNGEGQLISFDQNQGFVAATAEWLAEHGIAADLRFAELGASPRGWPGAWYEAADVPPQIDLLVVDGPSWSIHPYTRGAAEALFDRIPVGGTVMLDDARRPGERVVAARWRKRWPDFEFHLAPGGTKGTLVGTRLR